MIKYILAIFAIASFTNTLDLKAYNGKAYTSVPSKYLESPDVYCPNDVCPIQCSDGYIPNSKCVCVRRLTCPKLTCSSDDYDIDYSLCRCKRRYWPIRRNYCGYAKPCSSGYSFNYNCKCVYSVGYNVPHLGYGLVYGHLFLYGGYYSPSYLRHGLYYGYGYHYGPSYRHWYYYGRRRVCLIGGCHSSYLFQRDSCRCERRPYLRTCRRQCLPGFELDYNCRCRRKLSCYINKCRKGFWLSKRKCECMKDDDKDEE